MNKVPRKLAIGHCFDLNTRAVWAYQRVLVDQGTSSILGDQDLIVNHFFQALFPIF